MLCPKCGFCNDKMTADRFKKTFKVGDVIIGFPTKLEMTITAIGESRFMYKSGEKKEESIAAMNRYCWELKEKKEIPK